MIVQAVTDIGKVRPVNEDNYIVLEPNVYLVADGMGGESAGEVASQMVVDIVKRELEGRANISREDLCQVLAVANREIFARASASKEYHGMGTTATLLHVENNMAYWAHLGDSRLYLYRNDTLRQITTDHTYVMKLIEIGEITEKEAAIHPQRNLLLRAVGVKMDVKIDSGEIPVEENDVFLLCSDGLMKMLPDEKIKSLLKDLPKHSIAQGLVEAALLAGGTDNVTAVVVVNTHD